MPLTERFNSAAAQHVADMLSASRVYVAWCLLETYNAAFLRTASLHGAEKVLVSFLTLVIAGSQILEFSKVPLAETQNTASLREYQRHASGAPCKIS